MHIFVADIKDAKKILSLQRVAYQSEAKIYQDYTIPPLTETIEEIKSNFATQTFLKATDDKDNIIGSVRARCDNVSCFINRLIVHPEWQGKGVGTRLLIAIEDHFSSAKRYELFTGSKSVGNIRLYKRLGYKPFREQVVNAFLSLTYLEKNKIAPI